VIDPIAAGREANVLGKPYLILDVQPRKLILQAKKRGEMDPPPARPAFDIREAAPLYVREGADLLACTVMNIKETGPGFIEVELYQTGIVPEGA
jgi:hypothetical protein